MRVLDDALDEAKKSALLKRHPKALDVFERCFLNTLETTTRWMEDGTAFVFTGDIPAMWLRDSSAQVRHYLPYIGRDETLRRLIEGLIRRQVQYILIDPYANAFNQQADGRGHGDDQTEQSPWVWERKYETDSLCYPVQLAYLFWQRTGSTAAFDGDFHRAMRAIVSLWRTEQRHAEQSPYRFARTDCPESDTLRNDRLGMPANYTGMTWSGFRPSDDACQFHYLIPANMFAVVALGHIVDIAREVYGDRGLEAAALTLRGEIDYGIRTYGIVEHNRYGRIYAFETDGFGNHNLMDDANVPSLLSIPYLGYASADDPVYRSTRRFVLSAENPNYYEGSRARGVGSAHTLPRHIWPIGLTMQALTTDDVQEIEGLLGMLLQTDAGTGLMHESFHCDDPAVYTRAWFGWANSLFCELVQRCTQLG